MKITSLSFFFFVLFLNANAQDCNYTLVIVESNTGVYAEEMSWRLLDEYGLVVSQFQGTENNSFYEEELCLEDGCYTLEARDDFGDGWNGGNVRIRFENYDEIFELLDGHELNFYFGINTDLCVPQVFGCTDSESINFNPEATVDDGSCLDFDGFLDRLVWDTLNQAGPKDNRINWVIQNRGVNNNNGNFQSSTELLEFYNNSLFKAFEPGDDLEQEPYAQYRNFFNLYSVFWPDAPTDEEWWNFGLLHQMRDHYFLPWANELTGWVTWFSTTKYGGGGGAGLERDRRVGSGKMFGMGWETLLHEFGHTMPGLLDEYSADGSWSNSQCWETPNTTGFTNIDDIPWRKWIEPGTPLPTPYTAEYADKYGAFEGAMTNFFGCHRPSARSCFMGAGGFGEDYGQKLCGPCVQRVICYLYKYVHVIENPMPAETEIYVEGTEPIHFTVDLIKPQPNTQKYKWELNGKVIAEGVEELELTFNACESYELIFSVLDTNTLVRYDPKFEDTYPLPYQSFVWNINQTEVDNYNLSAELELTHPDCSNQNNGQVRFSITGGVAPYEVYLDGSKQNLEISGLAEGQYTFDVLDSNGCLVQETITLESEPVLEADICSTYDVFGWQLQLEVENYSIDELDILWSNGVQESENSDLGDGIYSVKLTTASGCQITKEIQLINATENLKVSAESFNSTLGQNNGRINLKIDGGRAPYELRWKEQLVKDQTDENTEHIDASGTTWDHLPEYAFDDNLNTKWLHFVPNDAWISYHFPEGRIINSYSITSGNDVPGRDPRNWVFQGSIDGLVWADLDSQQDQDFDSRYEKRSYLFSNNTAYKSYRFYVIDNHGDGSIQLQELEFLGINHTDEFMENNSAEDLLNRNKLAPGAYIYLVKDANNELISDTLYINELEPIEVAGLEIVKYDDCSVGILNPESEIDYYWFNDLARNDLLAIGNSFNPPSSGNFYVSAVHRESSLLGEQIKGFAVSMPDNPQVQALDDELIVIDPEMDLDYYWYDSEMCGDPIAIGTSYIPEEEGSYFVSAVSTLVHPDPIDPNDIDGQIVDMDAADLNGDGILDNPAPQTSSLLDWFFENGNHWSFGSWFAFRSNIQNGLGLVDFATIWYQSLEQGETNYQTVFLAYEENPISFPETAPFDALSYHMPKHVDSSQLFADSAPESTLEGSTFLNGIEVNPLEQSNPMEFCILALRMNELSDRNIRSTDTHWEGRLGELILYDHALSDDEITGISEFLRRKWISSADLQSAKSEIYWESMASSINEETEEIIRIYPNPVKDVLEVDGLSGTNSIEIFAMDGKRLYNWSTTTVKQSINLKQLISGSYILKVYNHDSEKEQTIRLIKH